MFSSLIDIVYPNLCPGCGEPLIKNEGIICLTCQTDIPFTNFYKDSENDIVKLFWGKINLEFAFGTFYFVKGGLTQNLIHALKYENNKEVGLFLGRSIGMEIKKSGKQIDVVIPVPLHPKKLKIRGYNQSDYLAEGICEVLPNVIIDKESLIRIEHSSSQTKKSKYERWENVGRIFDIKNAYQLEGKHVLLVDDVITTGSTIEACAQSLANINNIKISVATAAVPVS